MWPEEEEEEEEEERKVGRDSINMSYEEEGERTLHKRVEKRNGKSRGEGRK